MVPSMHFESQTLKKIIIFSVSIILSFGIGWFGNSYQSGSKINKTIEDRCFFGSSVHIDFLNANVILEITKNSEGYSFTGSLISNSNIDFGGNTSFYLQLSVDGGMPYKLSEELPYLEIVIDHTFPSKTDFSFSSKELKFTADQLEIVRKFLDKNTDILNISIRIYDHSKSLNHVINKVFSNK